MNANAEAQLRSFLRSFVESLRQRCQGRIPVEDLHRIATEEVERLRLRFGPPSWEAALPVRVDDARRHVHLFRPLRVAGHISALKDTQLLTHVVEVVGPSEASADWDTIGGDPSAGQVALAPASDADSSSEEAGGDRPRRVHVVKQEEVTSVCIRDVTGAEIWSLVVMGPDLISKLIDVRRAGLHAEFLGFPVAIPAVLDKRHPAADLLHGRLDIVLHIVDVRPSQSALNLVGATHEERAVVDDLRAGLSRAGRSPLVALREEVIHRLGIVATGEFELLRDLIEFTVLQALSCGRVSHASARLHLLLIGPPGQGKKLVGVAARVLNPVCAELSASKVSPAGLIGASHYSTAGWTSKPGLLPNAAHGVAVLQDAHGWSEANVRQVGPILQEVIEDGVVRSAVAGSVLREAPTALIIDANRVAHLAKETDPRKREAPILLLRPLLSRIDTIIEIPDDPERAWRIAGAMYDTLDANTGGGAEAPWMRECRLLVAHLRDRHPTIDLAPARARMKQVHEEVHEANRSVFQLVPEAGDIPTRLAITFARLVAASARAHDRAVATDEDVTVAMKFVNYKLDYLRLHVADVPVSERPDVQGERRRWIWRTYGPGAVVTASGLRERFLADTGRDASERTFRRDLTAMGARLVAKDRWKLPDTWTSGQGDTEEGTDHSSTPPPSEPAAPPDAPAAGTWARGRLPLASAA